MIYSEVIAARLFGTAGARVPSPVASKPNYRRDGTASRIGSITRCCFSYFLCCWIGLNATAGQCADRNSQTIVHHASTSHSASGEVDADTSLSRETLTQQRARLMANGEAALAKSDTENAAKNFERAGLMRHEADAELGMVRTYMQAGEYARALAFGAHTAGAHLDEPEGAALYAWLLHIGGQRDVARRLVESTRVSNPRSRLVAIVKAQLALPVPLATGGLMRAPTRFAPYANGSSVPRSARVAGTGVLIGDGRHALVPVTTLQGLKQVWVRNGLGQISRAVVERQLPSEGMTVLRLAQPLPVAQGSTEAARDPFPGSIAYAVEYAPSRHGDPAWPVLTSGFLGQAVDGGLGRPLGIELPKGPRGGPVFGKDGRWIGIARSDRSGVDVLVSVVALRMHVPELFGKPAAVGPDGPAAVDQIYDSSMRSALQIIVIH